MNEYKIILHGMLIIIGVVLLYYGYRYLIYLFRKKRLVLYSIKSTNNNIIFNFINIITNKLVITKYYKKRINKYDIYLDSDSNIKSKHILTIRFIVAILFALLYIGECLLFKYKINVFVVIGCFIVGIILVDLFLILRYKSKLSIFDNNITRIMIIMNNGYHINKNHKEVVLDIIEELDGPLKKELEVVSSDLDKGLDISSAFYKMYERTKDRKILYIARLLNLNVKYGISIVDICDRLEKDINNREKKENYIVRLDNTSKLMFLVLCLLPIVSFIIMLMLNISIISILSNSLIFVEVVLYIVYVLIIHEILRG